MTFLENSETFQIFFLPEKSIICTIDVVGLYPSVPNEEGLRFLRNALEKKLIKMLLLIP